MKGGHCQPCNSLKERKKKGENRLDKQERFQQGEKDLFLNSKAEFEVWSNFCPCFLSPSEETEAAKVNMQLGILFTNNYYLGNKTFTIKILVL